MEFTISSGHPETQRSACLILAIYEDLSLSPSAARIDQAGKGWLSTLVKRGDLQGKAGQTLLLHNPVGSAAERLLLVGAGKADKLDERAWHKLTGAALKALARTRTKTAFSYLSELEVQDRDLAWKTRQLALTAAETIYRFDRLKSEKSPAPALRKLSLDLAGGNRKTAQAALREAQAIARGMTLTRDLANLPGNICTPSYLASQARSLQKKYAGIKTTVLDEAAMKKLGMGALLSVASGSRQPARLISLEYKGGKKGDKPVVLVGKGVTFDSGGISIKPSAAMDEMKYDMCGAASVLGTLTAAAEMELPLNVVGIIPSTENLPDGQATKPGDIVTSMSGQTIEILNTDAEGRLILCDALSYAARFKPATVIDIATLTGACVIALGSQASGLLSNNEDLSEALLAAGRESGDRAWSLPLWPEYDEQLKSPFADMANIGGREAGTITAGCFLARFTRDYQWAHIDIAGTAWRSGKDKGATGRPVPLLTQYLLDRR